MKSYCRFAGAVFLLALLGAEARPIPWVKLPDLASESDVVVLGGIVSAVQVGVTSIQLEGEEAPSRVMVGDLHVQEIWKGTPDTSDITVRYDLPDDPIGYATPPVGTSAFFFLKQAGQEYRFTSPYRPAIDGMPGAMPEGGTLPERLAVRMSAMAESMETSSYQKLQAVYALGEIPSAASTEALQAVSKLSDPLPQLNAVAELLLRGDTSGLGTAVDALLNPAVRRSSVATAGLLIGITQGVKDPQAVPTLVTLLERGDEQARRAAASALMHTASPSATDALVRALDDPDGQVRYYAVVGLADITGKADWRPSPLGFREREAIYLGYWKGWAGAR
jgi:hypothetical protein